MKKQGFYEYKGIKCYCDGIAWGWKEDEAARFVAGYKPRANA